MLTGIQKDKIHFTETQVIFLEMTEFPDKILEPWPGFSIELKPKPIEVGDYRRLYFGVGEKWNWLDRMILEDLELHAMINDPGTDIYEAFLEEESAGFAEFVLRDHSVEIQYFGLMPAFIGRGFGKFFLEWTIHQAWSYRKERVQLNTCELDHPNAIHVYHNAGFRTIMTRKEKRRILFQSQAGTSQNG